MTIAEPERFSELLRKLLREACLGYVRDTVLGDGPDSQLVVRLFEGLSAAGRQRQSSPVMLSPTESAVIRRVCKTVEVEMGPDDFHILVGATRREMDALDHWLMTISQN